MSRARLITGAAILAPDPLPADHDSVGVVDGRIVAVGARHHVAAALPPDPAEVDLGGRVLAPGFVDAHLHPLPMCFFEHHLDVADCTGLDELFDALATRARGTEAGDDWVVGLRLDDEGLAERRLPTRTELDAVGGGRPVVILRRDGHHAVGSTAALDAAGIDPTTSDPPGGVIHRAADGSLTGLCGEAAAAHLLAAVPIPSWDELSSALDRLVVRLAACGITGISAICQTNDVGPSGASGELEATAWSLLVDQVPFDVQTILVATSAADLAAQQQGPLHAPDRRRRLDAVKLFLDGTIGGRTACMHAPYADGAGSGLLTLATESAYAQMVDAHAAGLQICIHAIGDRATATAAGLYERLLREHPAGDHRHRVEHASVLDDRTVELLAELGVAAVVQPISLASERRWLAKRLGDERIASVYPYRRMIDAGVRVAGSSDAPIESPDVLAAMACAVDRLGVGAHQAITPAEALALYTTSAAWVRRVERDSGTVAPGSRADLVVLSGDPHRGVDGIEVLATLASGVVLHADPAIGPW
jgi:predicted amidohydrolase YtcJ